MVAPIFFFHAPRESRALAAFQHTAIKGEMGTNAMNSM
jgi:hypothetical protein